MRNRKKGTITVFVGRGFEIQGVKPPRFGPGALNFALLISLAALSLAAVGCGKQSSQPDSQPADSTPAVAAEPKEEAAEAEGPAAIVAQFLEAMRTGNDKRATALLSSVAREKTASLNGSIRPPASDTAKFTVGKVETVGEDGARVASTWTDLDSDGPAKDRRGHLGAPSRAGRLARCRSGREGVSRRGSVVAELRGSRRHVPQATVGPRGDPASGGERGEGIAGSGGASRAKSGKNLCDVNKDKIGSLFRFFLIPAKSG